MMVIISMLFQDHFTGSARGGWSLHTASPLRAEAESPKALQDTGGPIPENFWGPASLGRASLRSTCPIGTPVS